MTARETVIGHTARPTPVYIVVTDTEVTSLTPDELAAAMATAGPAYEYAALYRFRPGDSTPTLVHLHEQLRRHDADDWLHITYSVRTANGRPVGALTVTHDRRA